MTIKRLIFLVCLCWPSLACALSLDTVSMVETLYPTADYSTDGVWSLTGCTAGEDCVDEVGTNDGNTSYIGVTNALDQDGWDVHTSQWYPLGLVKIDSVYFRAYAEINAGTAGKVCFALKDGSGSSNYFDTTGTLTTSYALYSGDQINNPYTGAAWTLDSIRNLRFGMRRTTNPSATRTIRVTQIYMEVYWQQLKQMDTITSQGSLFDAQMINGADTLKNYGGSTTLGVGRTITSKSQRMLFWVDTTFYDNWGAYYIDSAFLDLKTESMRGGTHDIVAHYVVWGSAPGTANGAAENGSVCWNYARYHASADAYTLWDAPGADSSFDNGGLDRQDFAMDSINVSADETVYSLRVGEWLNTVAGADWQNVYGYVRRADSTYQITGWQFRQELPVSLRIRQVSEALPDTVITFYAMDHATSGNRPVLRVFGTHR